MAEFFAAVLFSALMALAYFLIPAVIIGLAIAVILYFYLKVRKKEEALERRMRRPPRDNI